MLILTAKPGDTMRVSNVGPNVEILIISVKGDSVLFGIAPDDAQQTEPETTDQEKTDP
jgi:sRNA-binding carbon storage regulator CsrA